MPEVLLNFWRNQPFVSACIGICLLSLGGFFLLSLEPSPFGETFGKQVKSTDWVRCVPFRLQSGIRGIHLKTGSGYVQE